MAVGLRIPGLGLSALEGSHTVDIARDAERLGYDSLWTGELWGVDAFVRMTEVAHYTDEITLGTGVANVFSRSPAALTMAAASLSRVSGDRFVLGLGTSTPAIVEDLHGGEFRRPVQRLREAIELITGFTDRDQDRVDFSGEFFDVRDFPPLDADFPVYNAALGELNRRATGRLCDGWLPHNIPFQSLDRKFEAIADAAREAGRQPEEIAVAPYVPAVVSDEGEAAKEILQEHVAYYVGSADVYKRAVGEEFPQQADQISDAWEEGDHQRAASLVDADMRRSLGIAGEPEPARRQMERLLENTTIDSPILLIPDQADASLVEQTITELSPASVNRG